MILASSRVFKGSRGPVKPTVCSISENQVGPKSTYWDKTTLRHDSNRRILHSERQLPTGIVVDVLEVLRLCFPVLSQVKWHIDCFLPKPLNFAKDSNASLKTADSMLILR